MTRERLDVVLRALGEGIVSERELARALRLPAAAVHAALRVLETEGRAERATSNRDRDPRWKLLD